MPQKPLPPERDDDEVLEELRERRTYGNRAWEKIREEAAKDVQCVAGEVWDALDPKGKKQRDDAGRPSISCDEIGQYLNQIGNDVRQNKRAVKVTPIGLGATDKTAEFRAGLIREIEYRSNAQRDIYSPIFEDTLQRGYGFGRIFSQRVSETSKHQELLIGGFPNPDVVTPDPDGAMLAPDCSKIEWCFIVDTWSKKKFRREFGDSAKIQDFSDENTRKVPDWFNGESVQIAEYWAIERHPREVLYLKSDPSTGLFADVLEQRPPAALIADTETIQCPYVFQYWTNGLELLVPKGSKKRTFWGGKSIPVFSCFGKVLYVENSAGTERRLLSMVRFTRDPVMGLAYTQSSKVEILGSVPRATFIGYEGQFRGHETEWQKANHEPVPYLVARPFTEATGNQLLPLPQRQSWDPPLQNVDAAAESFRRSIQAAMGTSPLPTDAQRQNQKSGKALDRIESSSQKGAYHFIDHHDGMITRVGMLLDENIDWCYDAKREVMTRNPKDQPEKVAINDPTNDQAIDATLGHHDITISVGPAYTDEREESSEFADTIVGNAPLLQMVGPQKAAALIASAIRLKAVGPEGDHMADIIDPKPPEPGEPPTPEQLQQMQAESQGLQQQNQQLQQQIATDQAKQAGTIEAAKVKAQADVDKAKFEAAKDVRLQAMRDATAIAVAKINALTKGVLSANEAEVEAIALAHEAQQNEDDRAHEAALAAMEHQHALEAGQQAHEQGLQAGAQDADLAMEQAEHAQAIAPPEAAEGEAGA